MYRVGTLLGKVFVLSCLFVSVASAAQINLANREWTLLTIPANADEQTLESLFADDLPINSLGSDWAIFLFDQESQSYVAPQASESLKQGDGFWVIQATGTNVTIDVPDTLPSGDALASNACASSEGCFPARLSTRDNAVSWAILGAPYDQAVSVNDIRLQSSEPQCTNGCSLGGAANVGLLSNDQWVYAAGTSEYKPLVELTELQPWQAFWVASYPLPSATELKLLLPAPNQYPGVVIETHHETIPNPVFNSGFRVAASCKLVVQPCHWDNPATWQSGTVPDSTTLAIIDGHVQIRDRQATAKSIGVYPDGKLTFSATANTRLQTADLLVFAGGALEIGTSQTPIGSAYRAELIFRDLPFSAEDTRQHLRGLLAIDGVVRVFGHAFDDVFIGTAVEPEQGDIEISVTQSAKDAGWRVGDSIVIPNSTQCINAVDSCADLTEDRVISAISTDGLTLTLNQALQFDHPGAWDHAGSLDFTPHVINKSRNVIFRSENPDGIRGHLLFQGRADVDMRYAAMRSLGRTDIRNLGSINEKGRYPVHAHQLIGPVIAQSNGYQFTFVGNLVDFGEENREQNRKWGISIHGSHYGLIERNVIDHSSGAGIVLESGSEMGNLFKENFVVRVIGGNGQRTEDRDPGDGSKLGRAGTGYWFNGGGRNFFEKNIVAAIANCVYCYGFKFDNVSNGELLFPITQGSDPYLDGGEIINADVVGLNNFTGNEAYAVPNGLTVWWECTFGDYPNDDCSSRLDAFSVWHHHRWGFHGYPVNNMTLENFVVRGDPAVLVNRYEHVTGMDFGDYMHRNLLIVNADIQNMHTAIQMSSMRHERGASGPNVGFNTVEDSYLVATTGVGVWAPASVNGAYSLSPQTTILSNVRFDYPNVDFGDQKRAHIVTHDTSVVLDPNNMNQGLRNDVWVYNYNRAPGVDGDDLYIVPDYQGPSRCDNSIGQCDSEITANFLQVNKGHIYPLR